MNEKSKVTPPTFDDLPVAVAQFRIVFNDGGKTVQDLVFVDGNKAFFAFLGKPKERLEDHSIRNLFPEIDRWFFAVADKVLEKKTAINTGLSTRINGHSLSLTLSPCSFEDAILMTIDTCQVNNSITGAEIIRNKAIEAAGSEIETPQALETLLSFLGETFHASRCNLFSLDHNTLNVTHEWYQRGLTPSRAVVQRVPVFQCGRLWKDVISSGKSVVIEDTGSYATSDAITSSFLKDFSVNTTVAVPVTYDHRCIGVMAIANPPREEIDEACSVLSSLSDFVGALVTREEKEEKTLSYYYKDEISNTYSISYFLKTMSEIRKKAINANCGPYMKSCLYFTISQFSLFSNTYGVDAERECLKKIAGILSDVFQTSCIARNSTDSFVLFYDKDDVIEKTQEVHYKILHLYPDYELWTEAGIYYLQRNNRDHPSNACDLAKIACQMITSQSQFYNIYTEEIQQELMLKKYIQEHIDEAIQKGWIDVYYQPIIRALTKRLYALEALSRWKDPIYGSIKAEVFVKALEEKNLISHLDDYVIRTSVRFIKTVYSRGLMPVPVSINLSGGDFDNYDPFEAIEREVIANGIERSLIRVEIPESAVIESPRKIQVYLERFRKAGYEVILDNFGSLQSSLNSIRDFHFTGVKIAGEMIRTLNEDSKAILMHILRMMKDLRVHTSVNGVETQEQADYLRDLGYERLQGFNFSKPIPKAEVLTLMSGGSIPQESHAMRYLYDSIGNLKFHTTHMASLVFSDGHEMKVIYENPPLRKHEIAYGRCEHSLTDFLMNPINGFDDKMPRLLELCAITGKRQELCIHEDGRYYNLIIEIAGTSEIGRIFSIFAEDITDNLRKVGMMTDQMTMKHIIEFYDGIYKVSFANDQAKVIFSADGTIPVGEILPLIDLKFFQNIYWKDKSRFVSWFNDDNLRNEAKHNTNGLVINAFRFTKPNGAPEWKTITIHTCEDNDGFDFLMAMLPLAADMDQNKQIAKWIIEDNSVEGTAVTDMGKDDWHTGDNLWNTLTEQHLIKLFWKDRNRRFVGASRAFLDYYGFGSLEDIKGKTDEDIGWHIDDARFRQDELDVLTKGRTFVQVPGQNIIHGQVRDIVANKFPIYKNGEIVGLLGFFTDSTEIIPEKLIAFQKETMDNTTGMMTIQMWMRELQEFDANYNRINEDYRLIVFNVANYWSTFHNFGETTAEHLAKIVADSINGAIGERNVVSRISKETFAILSKDLHIGLINRLEKAMRALENISHIDEFPGRPIVQWGFANRSECTNSIRVYDLALQRAEDSEDYEAKPAGVINDIDDAISDEEDYQLDFDAFSRRITTLRKTFDAVRTVDSVNHRVLTFRKDGTAVSGKEGCYTIWDRHIPCQNCISGQALNSKGSLSKIETDGKRLYFVNSQYLEVDGKPCVLEIVKRLSKNAFYGNDSQEALIKELISIQDKLYIDSLTGVYNRRFYDEKISKEVMATTAILDIDNFKALNDTYGHLVGDVAIKQVAAAILSCCPDKANLLRYGGDEFLLTFREDTPETLRMRLNSILSRIRAIQIDDYPAIRLTASIGAVSRKAVVRKAIDEADKSLYKAKENKDSFIIE